MINSDEDPVGDRNNYKFWMFYYKPDDSRTLIRVPGSSNRYIFNYASWLTYLIIVPLLGVILYIICTKCF